MLRSLENPTREHRVVIIVPATSDKKQGFTSSLAKLQNLGLVAAPRYFCDGGIWYFTVIGGVKLAQATQRLKAVRILMTGQIINRITGRLSMLASISG
jgi:hypothetical protein